MKTNLSHSPAKGFTLIELLVVITIIVILAALSVGGFNYVTQKQALSQAAIQISLLDNALEDYKLDNGDYPPAGNSNSLYRILYWDPANATPPGKIYVNQLDPINNKQGWTEGTGANVKIMDPWGGEYIYRIGSDPKAKNPDFDILSKGKDATEDTPDDMRN
ncbi:type II secretion system protein [Akkermansiaceae bacterium]|nr:type II secretion system protein [Akkermansiaceae bacterium]